LGASCCYSPDAGESAKRVVGLGGRSREESVEPDAQRADFISLARELAHRCAVLRAQGSKFVVELPAFDVAALRCLP
jgi:hypothetical protein